MTGQHKDAYAMLVGNFDCCKGLRCKAGYLNALYAIRNGFLPSAYIRSEESKSFERQINSAIAECQIVFDRLKTAKNK